VGRNETNQQAVDAVKKHLKDPEDACETTRQRSIPPGIPPTTISVIIVHLSAGQSDNANASTECIKMAIERMR